MAHLPAPRVQAEVSCPLPDPAQLRNLSAPELGRLAAGLRSFLIEHVCATGGHLGPNLGAVELTLALHRAFDSPRDSLIFGTGHQAYVHKLLTGRAGRFGSLRQAGGLSGYASRAESEHDLVENSHASTALSYADGALTGGMAWEALNNLGAAQDRPVIVVLNDNGRSYEPTHGALAHHLHTLKSGKGAAGSFIRQASCRDRCCRISCRAPSPQRRGARAQFTGRPAAVSLCGTAGVDLGTLSPG